ncbi:CU044_5270 family protein [uncultured Arthrobacter sp.]|uniref:CU044_5270 family protein n=1 Tax=uncultured Arthrobacter sp. TaxID=114050 RepID=UPI00262834E6|nr:CU044_5270 family protein [uncultured Arthrobacter sp.]
MDELQLLRETRNHVGTVPPAVLARGRNRLMKLAEAETTVEPTFPASPSETDRRARSNVRPLKTWRRVVMVSAAAAFLVGALVTAEVVMPDRPGATAEAAEVLHEAAAATIETEDTVVLPGQYLKIETEEMTGGSSVANGEQISWKETTGGQVYVPADLTGEWVWNREARVPTASAPEEVKEAARLEPIVDPRTHAMTVGVFRAQGGAFYDNEQTVVGVPITDLQDLPRDPRELLNRIYDQTWGSGKTPDLRAFGIIIESLRTGVIPADLRAAFYQAAALIPGVDVTDRQATIDGRTGVAIGMKTPDGVSREDIIIDPSSGLVIGEQVVILKDYPGAPAGTVESWTSVQTSVVDSAP